MSHPLDFIQEIHLPASPEAVWNALVQPELVKQYHLAPLLKIEMRKGGEILYGTDQEVMISGALLEFEKPHKLIHSFRFGSKNHQGTATDPDSLVCYELHPEDQETLLKLTHSGFTDDNQTRANIMGGWPHILNSLKAFLESTSR